jgi:hypothetical protein
MTVVRISFRRHVKELDVLKFPYKADSIERRLYRTTAYRSCAKTAEYKSCGASVYNGKVKIPLPDLYA